MILDTAIALSTMANIISLKKLAFHTQILLRLSIHKRAFDSITLQTQVINIASLVLFRLIVKFQIGQNKSQVRYHPHKAEPVETNGGNP